MVLFLQSIHCQDNNIQKQLKCRNSSNLNHRISIFIISKAISIKIILRDCSNCHSHQNNNNNIPIPSSNRMLCNKNLKDIIASKILLWDLYVNSLITQSKQGRYPHRCKCRPPSDKLNCRSSQTSSRINSSQQSTRIQVILAVNSYLQTAWCFFEI